MPVHLLHEIERRRWKSADSSLFILSSPLSHAPPHNLSNSILIEKISIIANRDELIDNDTLISLIFGWLQRFWLFWQIIMNLNSLTMEKGKQELAPGVFVIQVTLTALSWLNLPSFLHDVLDITGESQRSVARTLWGHQRNSSNPWHGYWHWRLREFSVRSISVYFVFATPDVGHWSSWDLGVMFILFFWYLFVCLLFVYLFVFFDLQINLICKNY